jgi:hypothetical protein
MLGMEAQIPSNVVFLLAQLPIGEFSDGSALLADHEAMAALHVVQAAFYESAAGQHFVSQIEAAKQVEDAIDGNVIQMLATLAQKLLYVVGRKRSFCLVQYLKHQLPRLSRFEPLGLQHPN